MPLVGLVLIAVVCFAPVLALLGQIDGLGQIITGSGNVLESAASTLELCLLTLAVALVLGIPSAWLTAVHTFPGRRLFIVLLPLSLCVPGYIASYSWVGIFHYAGSYPALMSALTGTPMPEWTVNVMSAPMLAVILGSVLYPYIFLVTRASFLGQSATVLEAAALLGAGSWRSFFRIALPLARPALVGGCVPVVLETLNEFGAVKYFGLHTLTTDIFSAWFSAGNSSKAFALSTSLLCIAGLVLGLEAAARSGRRYSAGSRMRPLSSTPLRGAAGGAAALACVIPIMLGLAMPVGQMFYWLLLSWGATDWQAVWQALATTLFYGVGGALCVVASGLLLSLLKRMGGAGAAQAVALQAASLGYAIPGAVIAVGAIAVGVWIDSWAVLPAAVMGSAGLLIYAYTARYTGVGYQAIDSGMEKAGTQAVEAAQMLGRSRMRALVLTALPMARHSVLAAAMLAFVDIAKELPLTLILRPFNTQTLATLTYEYAGDEIVSRGAVSALAIVVAGALANILFTSSSSGRR